MILGILCVVFVVSMLIEKLVVIYYVFDLVSFMVDMVVFVVRFRIFWLGLICSVD